MGLLKYDAPLGSARLQPQDLVMTMLGANVRGIHEQVWSGGLVALLGEMGFSTAAARVALTRLVKRDLLARVRTGRLIHYRITEHCDQVLAEGDRRIFSLGTEPSGGPWTILWHDLPEDRVLERVQLARRLRFLGFGSLQDGLWVSPIDREGEVTPILERLDISQHVGMFSGEPTSSLGLDVIVQGGWDLPALTARYGAFAAEFEPALTEPSDGDDEAAFKLRIRLIHLYRGFAFMDPGLSDAMLEDADSRRRAVAAFHELYSKLAPAAQRHFDSVAGAEQPERAG